MTSRPDVPADASGDVEVVVGRIGRPHGLRGEVTVEIRTDEPERRFQPGVALRAEPPSGSTSRLVSLTVASVRRHQTALLIGFDELPDRTAAEGARGTLLHVTVAAGESPDDPDEFYDHQLVGLVAHDEDGVRLGEVAQVLHGAAQDLLEIRTPDGRLALVPFVKALVPAVDLAAGRLTVADRPGLVTPLESPADARDQPAGEEH